MIERVDKSLPLNVGQMFRVVEPDRSNGAWITTFSGRRFYVLDPRPQDVCIEDIAHALALQCRFTGHIRKFYSVAQHCVLVSRFCPQEFALWGLLHDASEAYIGDMSAPLKHTPEMSRFRTTEQHIMLAIAEHFGLGLVEPPAVKQVDRRLCLTEARDLLGSTKDWQDASEPYAEAIVPWTPAFAERAFLCRFQELTSGR